jgi:hypothetical protein
VETGYKCKVALESFKNLSKLRSLGELGLSEDLLHHDLGPMSLTFYSHNLHVCFSDKTLQPSLMFASKAILGLGKPYLKTLD